MIGRIAGWIALQGRFDKRMIQVGVGVGKQLANLFISAKTNGAQQNRHRQLTLAVYLDADDVALAGLKLQPSATAGDPLGPGQIAARAAILFYGKIDAR